MTPTPTHSSIHSKRLLHWPATVLCSMGLGQHLPFPYLPNTPQAARHVGLSPAHKTQLSADALNTWFPNCSVFNQGLLMLTALWDGKCVKVGSRPMGAFPGYLYVPLIWISTCRMTAVLPKKHVCITNTAQRYHWQMGKEMPNRSITRCLPQDTMRNTVLAHM